MGTAIRSEDRAPSRQKPRKLAAGATKRGGSDGSLVAISCCDANCLIPLRGSFAVIRAPVLSHRWSRSTDSACTHIHMQTTSDLSQRRGGGGEDDRTREERREARREERKKERDKTPLRESIRRTESDARDDPRERKARQVGYIPLARPPPYHDPCVCVCARASVPFMAKPNRQPPTAACGALALGATASRGRRERERAQGPARETGR